MSDTAAGTAFCFRGAAVFALFAGGSLPLFGQEGVLAAGARALRLWPHPNLQAARDPDLLKPKVE